MNKARELLSQKADELQTEKRKFANNEQKIKERRQKLQELAGGDKIIPECPICLETMTAETPIYSCKNGHLVCGTCKPRVKTCATCRSGKYIYRNTAVEQIVRRALLMEE